MRPSFSGLRILIVFMASISFVAAGLASKSPEASQETASKDSEATAASTNMANGTSTLAEQLRIRLEQRQKFKEQEQWADETENSGPFKVTSSQHHMASEVAFNSAISQSPYVQKSSFETP